MSDGGGRDDGGSECEQLKCGCSNTGVIMMGVRKRVFRQKERKDGQ